MCVTAPQSLLDIESERGTLLLELHHDDGDSTSMVSTNRHSPELGSILLAALPEINDVLIVSRRYTRAKQ
jgi:hypothetical protein